MPPAIPRLAIPWPILRSALLKWLRRYLRAHSGGRRMWRRIALRSALIAGLAAAVTSLPATATLNPAPATTVRMAKIGVPGKPLRAFDISWVDSASGHYYLADR